MATAEALMTAEEFGRRPDPGYPEELVQGRIVAILRGSQKTLENKRLPGRRTRFSTHTLWRRAGIVDERRPVIL